MVIDASVAMAIIRDEANGPQAAAAMARWTRNAVRIVVPSHFWLEVTNSLMRRHRLSGAAVLEGIHGLDQFGLETMQVDRPMLVSAIDLAERHRLTSYDAAYLALADAIDGALLTFDNALRAAAGARAVGVDGHRLSDAPAPYEHDVTWPSYKGASAYLAKLRAQARATSAS